jgi:deoxyribodipyrimidine photo-lyase
MAVLVLFTRDLRIHDHPALTQACRTADEVVPLFVVDPSLVGRSPNRTRFLYEALSDLDRSLAHRGGRLLVREGDVPAKVIEVASEAACDRIFLTRDASAYAADRARRLTERAENAGIPVRSFPGHAVIEPGEIVPDGRAAYRVFTPYHRAWVRAPGRPVLAPPRAIRVPRGLDPGRLPTPEGAGTKAIELPPGGETVGRKRMLRFVAEGAADYAVHRDDLEDDATSRLSGYLRFGCVSANELASRIRGVTGGGAFLRQLAWRDFFGQLLADHPEMAWEDLRGSGGGRQRVDDAVVDAWTSGRTGVPLVDAGMRQLLREGWMHNRARLVTASFLTRRAQVPWQVGAEHFMHHLVDGDPASNSGNWQWSAGTGASPRRGQALSPVRQAERFDPDGVYVRRYVPELADAGRAAVLRPWRHPELLRRTGYPAPIVDLPG